jgi:hypothetical protein
LPIFPEYNRKEPKREGGTAVHRDDTQTAAKFRLSMERV